MIPPRILIADDEPGIRLSLGGVLMPAPVICPHCHHENVRRRESVGKDDHGQVLYKYSRIHQCRQCGAQLHRDLPGREILPEFREKPAR